MQCGLQACSNLATYKAPPRRTWCSHMVVTSHEEPSVTKGRWTEWQKAMHKSPMCMSTCGLKNVCNHWGSQMHVPLQLDCTMQAVLVCEYYPVRGIRSKVTDARMASIKVVPYSENCLVFMFNGGSSSSLTICPIDKKIGMENPTGMCSLLTGLPYC